MPTSDCAPRRRVLLLDLVDDAAAIAAYRDWHRPGGPPAAVTRAIREAGVVTMEIYNAGNRLVMVMEVAAGHDPAAQAAADRDGAEVQAWEAQMDAFQRRLPFAPPGVKWVEADPIYSLADQTA